MRIILAVFPDKVESFSTLSPFFNKYPQYKELTNRINESISRKKNPYIHSDFTIHRLTVIKK